VYSYNLESTKSLPIDFTKSYCQKSHFHRQKFLVRNLKISATFSRVSGLWTARLRHPQNDPVFHKSLLTCGTFDVKNPTKNRQVLITPTTFWRFSDFLNESLDIEPPTSKTRKIRLNPNFNCISPFSAHFLNMFTSQKPHFLIFYPHCSHASHNFTQISHAYFNFFFQFE